MSVHFIPAGVSFVDALARQVLAETAGDPLSLTDMLILLPTRRSCRALGDAFLRAADGAPLILPRMRPLGDAPEDTILFHDRHELDLPPAVTPLRRLLLLARAVQHLGDRRGGHRPNPEQAIRLAGELADLLDQVQIEGLTFGALRALVPADYAAHWQVTLEFLEILTEHWPAVLAEQGWMDAAARRNRLLAAQAAAWAAEAPTHAIIAAGSTGSIPAVARLLAVIAGLPRGRVVLPGLDPTVSAGDRAHLDETHPQFGLYRLLDHLGVAASAVACWPGCVASPRAWLAGQAMRPAPVTEGWRDLRGQGRTTMLDGLRRVDCPGPREEAVVVALMLRQALDTPGRTAALVTPDRGLARRVAAQLDRYDIEIDDSAGRPLTTTMPGAFLALTASMLAEQCAPHATLAALKHPLAVGGLPPGHFRHYVRRLERAALRGPRPLPGLDGLLAAVAAQVDLHAWLAVWSTAARPLERLLAEPTVSLSAVVGAHRHFVESLAGDGEGGLPLWRGEAGQAAQSLMVDVQEAGDTVPPFSGRLYPGLLRSLMDGIAVRPRYGRHPRLSIWGPLEARLQHVDLLILGGLNEGVWPPEADADPWMSRPMRRAFGLPPPERRIGLSAHDFVQAFCAPEVVLTRATRAEGAPTVPSRWLQRLDAVLCACRGDDRGWPETPWVGWAAALDRPAAAIIPTAPAPCPPARARPRRLSVTAIETWMRDPYAIYARWILGLRLEPPIDEDPGAADYGSLVHDALRAFLQAHPHGRLPDDALPRLIDDGRRAFADLALRPGLIAFWWPRFERIAAWFIDMEVQRRPGVRASYAELEGSLTLPAPFGPFTLTARADRIDRLTSGGLSVIDYKTGMPPTVQEVAAGYAPQLPLEAAIAAAGRFAGLTAAPVEQLAYWRLTGSSEGGRVYPAGSDAARLAAEALEGVARLVAIFDDPTTPYRSRPHPVRAPRYSDYLHLARVKEWSAADEDER